MIRALIIAFLILLPSPAWAMKVGEQASAFCLQDAHGKTHRLSSFSKRILVVWYEGAKSRIQNQWIKVRLAQLARSGKLNTSHYESVGVANYQESLLPDSLITKVIRDHTRGSAVKILLDKDGILRQRWGFFNGRSNIYVFDSKRRLIWRSSGPLTRRLGRQLIRIIVRRSR